MTISVPLFVVEYICLRFLQHVHIVVKDKIILIFFLKKIIYDRLRYRLSLPKLSMPEKKKCNDIHVYIE